MIMTLALAAKRMIKVMVMKKIKREMIMLMKLIMITRMVIITNPPLSLQVYKKYSLFTYSPSA